MAPMIPLSVCFAKRHWINKSTVRNISRVEDESGLFDLGLRRGSWKWQTTTTSNHQKLSSLYSESEIHIVTPFEDKLCFLPASSCLLPPPLTVPLPLPIPTHTLRGLIWQREKSQMNTNTLTDVSENLHVGLSVCAQTQILYYCCRSVLITHSCPQGTEGWLLFFAPSEAHNHLYSEEFA